MSILVIWTIVAAVKTTGSIDKYHDWRPIATFESQAACHNAAAQLGYKNNDRYRCLGGEK